MSDVMRISAKTLGSVAMPDFCHRCFWTRMHLEGGTPYSIFPRIFGDIDRYTKRVVHGHFEKHGAAPSWLKDLDVTGYIDPPPSAKFNTVIGDDVVLTGEADAIFTKSDGSLLIGDYKTAIAHGVDDRLYPIYKVQLNSYAFLAKALNMGTASQLALIYTEPLTDGASAQESRNLREDGFTLGFRARVVHVPLDPKGFSAAIRKAKEVYDATSMPQPAERCKDCMLVDRLKDLVNCAEFDFSTI